MFVSSGSTLKVSLSRPRSGVDPKGISCDNQTTLSGSEGGLLEAAYKITVLRYFVLAIFLHLLAMKTHYNYCSRSCIRWGQITICWSQQLSVDQVSPKPAHSPAVVRRLFLRTRSGNSSGDAAVQHNGPAKPNLSMLDEAKEAEQPLKSPAAGSSTHHRVYRTLAWQKAHV